VHSSYRPAYRKYGSRAARWPVVEKSFCSSDELVDSAKNGSPIEDTKTTSSHEIGFEAKASYH
ncbi:MAG: hypothetical protein HY654_01240, partial [Acidobacteria bacterium]|nr:hypothetical protein [Acidobacteriota bacterium]